MSATKDDPSFARVWVKDEPDDNIVEEMVDGIAYFDEENGEEHCDDESDDDEYTETGLVEIDPMSIVKSETATSDTEDPDVPCLPSATSDTETPDAPWEPREPKGEDDRTEDWKPLPSPVRTTRGLKYQCPHCPYKGKLTVLRSHMRKHEGKKEFKCPFCEFTSNYDTALRRHLKTMHADDSDGEPKRPRGKKRPRKVHVKKYHCTLCPYVTAHRHGLRSHMLGIHQDEKRLGCSFCDFRTKYSTAMRRHRFTQHKAEVKQLGEASKEFKCRSCDFVAYLRSQLQQHEKKHLLKHRCDICRHRFDSEQDLLQHTMLHHNPNGPNPTFKPVKSEKPDASQIADTEPIFKCKICQHEAVTYDLFREHVKTHERAAPYRCNVCGYETACNGTFLRHLQQDHGVTEDGMNDIKAVSEGIASAMQAISMGAAADSDDEPLASHAFDDAPSRRPAKPNKYTCTICSYNTPHKGALKTHMCKHGEGKPHQCPFCQYCTKYPNAIRRHKRLKHPESFQTSTRPEEYVCDSCPYKTFYKNNFNQHLRKHGSEKEFKCDKCTFETSYRTAFYRHAKIHKRKTAANGQALTLQCEMCPFSSQYEGRFAWHMLKTHNIRKNLERGVKCDFCDFETSDKLRFRLTAHIHRSKQSTPMKCLHCDFETLYKCEVKYHRKSHYVGIMAVGNVVAKKENSPAAVLQPADVPENLAKTNFPPVSTQSLVGSYKDDNYEVESDIAWKKIPVLENRGLNKPFSCYKCPYASRFKSSVQRHFQRLHGNKAKPYRCSHCDFGTSTKDSIALHTKRSKQSNAIACECGQFSSFYKCEFVVHQKLHNPFRCSKCTYSSKSKYDLERHYTMHTNRGGYRCQFCDFISVRRDTLVTHEVTHTGVRPFQCHLCAYGTMRLTFLEKHIMDKHHGDASKTKPFQCHVCSYGSFSQAILDRHLSQMHTEPGRGEEEMDERAEATDTADTVDNADTQTSTLNTSYYDDSTQDRVSVEMPVTATNDSSFSTFSERVQEKGVKPFPCPVCPYSAFSPKVLKKHMSIHSEAPAVDVICDDAATKPFQCHLCPYSSFRPNILKNHLILKHSVTPPATFVEEYSSQPTEKTYQCHLCSYGSMSLNVLNKHLVLKHGTSGSTANESTVKRFQCHHCPFNSLNQNVLKKHVLQTHSVLDVLAKEECAKPFKCRICPYSTFSPKVLSKHVVQRHPGVSSESYNDNSLEVVSVVSEND